MAPGTKISVTERKQRIQAALARNQRVTVAELAAKFQISEMTIRRDLDQMHRTGHVQRTHGGAVASERMSFEFDFAWQRKLHQREKQAIARKACAMIQAGQRVILDTGTSTLELAYLLKDFTELTVVTPSLAVASVLQFSPGIQTVLLGGVIRKGSPDLTGAVTEANLNLFAADFAFQGADGIGSDGAMYSNDLRIARVDQLIRKRAERSYVLADSSKIGKTALTVNGYLNEIDGLITDSGIARDDWEKFKKTGAQIMVVKV